ncbi:MAG TPA: hypothetical protein VHZ54_14775 [Solirubrobacterales bacterium]|nr:hypothetical protein [Solirubrobacterales bacterium]
MIDDIETGFSPKNPKENRPYVVIGCAGRRVRVMPQSTDMSNGVMVPDGALEGLEEGCFVPFSTTIRLSLALGCPCVGHLGEPYLGRILAQARPKP